MPTNEKYVYEQPAPDYTSTQGQQQPVHGSYVPPAGSPPFQQTNSYSQSPQPLQEQQTGMQQPVQTKSYQNTIPIASLSSSPAPVECPNCHQRTLTAAEFKTGNTTWAWCVGLGILTFCCCIPFCVKATKDVWHKCGNCGIQLAHWHRSGRTEVLCHM